VPASQFGAPHQRRRLAPWALIGTSWWRILVWRLIMRRWRGICFVVGDFELPKAFFIVTRKR